MNSILSSGIIISGGLLLVWWLAIRAGRGIVILGSGQEMPDELRREYINNLSKTVKIHRWLGVSILALIVVTIVIIIWQTSRVGWEKLLTIHVANEAAFLGLARFVFKKTGEYEAMLRDALGFDSHHAHTRHAARTTQNSPPSLRS